jgi:guanylate kinase
MSWLEEDGNVDATVVNDNLDEAYAQLKRLIHEWYPDMFEDEISAKEE